MRERALIHVVVICESARFAMASLLRSMTNNPIVRPMASRLRGKAKIKSVVSINYCTILYVASRQLHILPLDDSTA